MGVPSQLAADGSGGVSVYPSGKALPASPLSSSSTAEAIAGFQAGGCAGCAMSQACSLFNAAAIDYQSQFAKKCPARSPSAESVVHLGASVVSFADPPGITGNGNPSGGQYVANGVMTYHRVPVFSSWLDTCTLPSSDRPICTVALNRFIDWYGS